ncbi:hypothetical protein N665_0977s0002 [Sinapis alba]|nr:hypothetical protein N665_0977s0002 [Sinapis alba]
MASYKGKTCVIDEEDDDPIHISDQADENLIREYSFSLIGKILNPQNQNWGISEKITACDLVNGRFLFNFYSEEDLNAVLSLGPVHHNDCMFVLNLQGICDKLGKVETIDAPKGKLKNREDIIIKLHYDMLFKHCSLCGLMTHEAEDCLKMTVPAPVVNGRETMFDRIKVANTIPIERSLHNNQGGSSKDSSKRILEGSSSMSYNDRSSYQGRVQQSSHSSRDQRSFNSRGNRYKSYYYVCKDSNAGQHGINERDLKEKTSQPLKIGSDSAKASGSGSGTGVSSGVACMAVKKNPNPLIPQISQSSKANILIEATPQIINSNITFRKNHGLERLTRFATTRDNPWFMICYFNKIRGHHEKEGGK